MIEFAKQSEARLAKSAGNFAARIRIMFALRYPKRKSIALLLEVIIGVIYAFIVAPLTLVIISSSLYLIAIILRLGIPLVWFVFSTTSAANIYIETFISNIYWWVEYGKHSSFFAIFLSQYSNNTAAMIYGNMAAILITSIYIALHIGAFALYANYFIPERQIEDE